MGLNYDPSVNTPTRMAGPSSVTKAPYDAPSNNKTSDLQQITIEYMSQTSSISRCPPYQCIFSV